MAHLSEKLCSVVGDVWPVAHAWSRVQPWLCPRQLALLAGRSSPETTKVFLVVDRRVFGVFWGNWLHLTWFAVKIPFNWLIFHQTSALDGYFTVLFNDFGRHFDAWLTVFNGNQNYTNLFHNALEIAFIIRQAKRWRAIHVGLQL